MVVQLWSGCPGSEVNVAAAAAATTPALTVLHEENKQLQVTVEEGQPSRPKYLSIAIQTSNISDGAILCAYEKATYYAPPVQ